MAVYELTDPTPLQVFTAQLDAFNAHDLTGFLATYALDAVVVSSTGSTLRGRELMHEHYSRRLATPNLRCDVLSATPVGSRWIVAHELVGDDSMCTEVVATFEIVDGLIRSSMLMVGDSSPRGDGQ